MADILYFAYGSNLLRERLLARCPNSRYMGRAALADNRLTFDKVSTDGSGKCALEASEGNEVPGVLWLIPEREKEALDRAEGAGRGYEGTTVSVLRGDSDVRSALAYQATNLRAGQTPYDWYLVLVLAGAIQQGLPDAHIDRLRAQPFVIDPDAARPTRLDAIAALEKAKMMEVLHALGA